MTRVVDINKIKAVTITSFEELSQCYFDYEKSNIQPLMNSFVWLKAWYDIYWQANWLLNSLAIYQDDKIIAIAPLYCRNQKQWIQPTILYPLGQGEPENAEIASEYLDILISPGYEDVALDEISLYLKSIKVDQIIWRAVLTESHIYNLMTNVFEDHIEHSNTRYLLETKHWSIKELSKNTRSRYKRSLNQFQKYNAIFVWINPCEFKQNYQTLVKFHQIRWQKKDQLGAFSHPDFNIFHLHLLINHSDSIKMSAILVEGQAIAINYYLSDATTLYFYQSGWDESEFSKTSPGMALHIWSIENSDHQYYDFMMGSKGDSYKAKFATQQQPMYNITLTFSPIKLMIHRVLKKLRLINN